MRGHLRSLSEAGVIERVGSRRPPGAVGYELTAAGRDLQEVSQILTAWLEHSPQGEMQLGSARAKSAIRALVDGWGAGMVRALVARPLSLTELDGIIASLTYPALERRLAAMRLLDMVEATSAAGRGRPYTVTAWLRRSIGPLAAATRWERRHRPDQTPPITNRDVEASFMLSLPLLRLDAGASGRCRLAVQTNRGRADGLIGVVVEVRDGLVVSCVTDLDRPPDSWIHSSPDGWLAALLDADESSLEVGGTGGLAGDLVKGMQGVLLRR
jgi:DNA-binding HxlR family transcriptional regulator